MAHEAEVEQIRQDPEGHPNYAHQHTEFMGQAVKTCKESGEVPDMESIEKMWQVYWKMQVEKSFLNIWEKRVNNLSEMLTGSNELSNEDKLKLSKLAFG